MNNCKSVQELIVKAAMYDGITTTIRSKEMLGMGDVLEIIFSKRDMHSSTYIDVKVLGSASTPEMVALHSCKRALYDLFMAPYEEITCEENKHVSE